MRRVSKRYQSYFCTNDHALLCTAAMPSTLARHDVFKHHYNSMPHPFHPHPVAVLDELKVVRWDEGRPFSKTLSVPRNKIHWLWDGLQVQQGTAYGKLLMPYLIVPASIRNQWPPDVVPCGIPHAMTHIVNQCSNDCAQCPNLLSCEMNLTPWAFMVHLSAVPFMTLDARSQVLEVSDHHWPGREIVYSKDRMNHPYLKLRRDQEFEFQITTH